VAGTVSHAGMFQIDDFEAPDGARRLARLQLTSTGQSSYDELWLQRLIAIHPQVLPIAEIEPYLEGAVPVCMELGTAAGFVDVVLVTPRGDLVLVECKLWRNPQARREVVGQIIDYAKELPRLSYEAFEAAVCKAVPTGDSVKTDVLYQRSGAQAAGLGESSFIDAVSRNLRRGRFLLLIVGDGIREGVEIIVEFMQQRAGMHFTLALVEVAIFTLPAGGYVVQPRILSRTTMIPRGIVAIEDDRPVIREPDGCTAVTAKPDRLHATPASISEARLYEALESALPGAANQVKDLVAALEQRGPGARFTSTQIVLQGATGDRILELGRIDTVTTTVWFEGVAAQSTAYGLRDAGLSYYQSLALLVRDDKLRSNKINPKSKTATATLPLADLLAKEGNWLASIDTYLAALAADR
jgi:hypothetical protein